VINGTVEDAYNALPKYCEDLNQSNPDSTIVLECTPEGDAGQRFQRIFVCYSASAIGFGYCRPVLGLDGTHLKTKYYIIRQSLILVSLLINGEHGHQYRYWPFVLHRFLHSVSC